MDLTAVEIIAAFVSIIGLIKILAVIFNRKAWYNGVFRKIYSKPKTWGFVYLMLAMIVLYYLIPEVNIVHFMASAALIGLLMGVAFMSYSKEFIILGKEVYGKKIGGWARVTIVIWVVLTIWALYEIFLV